MLLNLALLAFAASLLTSVGVFAYAVVRGEWRARKLARINESPEQSAGA